MPVLQRRDERRLREVPIVARGPAQLGGRTGHPVAQLGDAAAVAAKVGSDDKHSGLSQNAGHTVDASLSHRGGQRVDMRPVMRTGLVTSETVPAYRATGPHGPHGGLELAEH